MIEQIKKELQETGQSKIRNFGTFTLKPARKGKINGFGEGLKPKHKYRVTFVPSPNLKEEVCK